MTQWLSKRAQAIKPSPTIAVASRSRTLKKQGHSVISLGIGEPDFDTPQHIKDACNTAMTLNHTHYAPVDGIDPLKQAISSVLQRDHQLNYDDNQILVSTGAKQCLFNLCKMILDEGDEAIIPAPYWVSYPAMVELAGATPVEVQCHQNNQYKITPNDLENAITSKTKLFFFNSPNNPTGMVYTAKEINAIAAVLLKFPHVMIICDDIYEKLLFDGTTFEHLLTVEPKLYDRTVIVNGVSKAYAMTGWRIGYSAGPVEVIQACKKIQSQSTSGANTLAQYAAVAALEGDQACIDTMLSTFQTRHDYFYQAINALPGFSCLRAQGAFYLFADITDAIAQKGLEDDVAFATSLLESAFVATVPGTAFGSPNHLRLSFSVDIAILQEAIKRMQAFMQS